MTFAFTALDLDRAGEAREDSSWVRNQFDSRHARTIVLTHEGHVLLALPERRLLGLPLLLMRDRFEFSHFIFLGCENDTGVFAITLDDAATIELAHEFNAEAMDLRMAAANLEPQEAGVAAFARSLSWWQSRTRFCGSCGASTLLSAGGHRALCSNAACATVHFPRTDMAMIVLVRDGQRCLLGRQANWPENRFSTLAGFLEPGETLEACVRREVFEESGVRVGACQYVANQPWPFPASLMIGFTAQAESTAIHVGAELAEARWFSPTQIQEGLAKGTLRLSPRLSISRYLIEHWYIETTGAALG